MDITAMRSTMRTAMFALAALVAMPAADTRAATILFNDFSNLSSLQLNNATAGIHGCGPSGAGSTCSPVDNGLDGNVLRLTNGLSQSGSAFSTNTVSLDQNASFSTAFQFRITDPEGISDEDGQGADGIVFVVQTVSNQAGSSGGGIGYQNIPTSLGVEFDTWDNGAVDGSSGNHVGVDLGGNIASNPRVHIDTGTVGRMNNGALWYAWVDYNGATDALEVRLNTQNLRPTAALISTSVDLVAELGQTDAFVGFTSGTGGAGGDHDIVAWQFNSTFSPIAEVGEVSEPATLAVIAAGLLAAGAVRRRVP